jgi:hypothetical protein
MILADTWADTYKPIKNPNNDWGGDYSAFETYSPEVDFVWSKPDNLVWTEIDGDDGSYIIAGKHLVNRLQYFVCEVPWTDENLTAVISVEKECDDCNGVGEEPEKNADGSYDDCWLCGGRGFFTHYPDTMEELEQLIGKERANG